LRTDESIILTIGTFDFTIGTYTINAAVDAIGDINPANDTASQTTDVSERPFFYEGFEGELSTDWEFVNGSSVNRWIVGTGTSSEGNKSAYISSDGTSNHYTNNSSQVNISCLVEFPFSEEDFDIYFDVRCVGTGGSNTLYTVQIGSTFLGNFSNISEWQTIHRVLPASFSGTTRRLQFSWTNTSATPNQPPAAVDNIAIVARSTYTPPSGISDITPQTSPLKAWIQNGILHISGLAIGQTWRMYNISGTPVYQSIAKSDVEMWHAKSLPNGTYIIYSENQSIKIVW
jgi:hypothetical protein